MQSILTVTPADYRAQWEVFDEGARQLGLTPADRSLAWRELTRHKFPGGRDFYEWPVPIDHFLTDPFYLGGNVNVRDAIMDVLVDYTDPSTIYEILVFVAGVGTGKSYSAACVIAYLAYVLSTIRRPEDGGKGAHRYLSQFPGVDLDMKSEIALTNVSAAGAKQAKRVIFAEVAAKLDGAPYFHRFFEPYEKSDELEFPGRIKFAPGTSQARSVLGLNVFWYAIDEAAFAVSDDKEQVNVGSVKALFEQLETRRRSRFGHLGGGGLYTSPQTETAYVEMLAGENVGETLVRRLSTWEAKGLLVPGAQVFLLDEDPDRPRIVHDGPLIYVAPGLAQDPETGELVRFGPLQPPGESRAREVLRDETLRSMTAGGGVAP